MVSDRLYLRIRMRFHLEFPEVRDSITVQPIRRRRDSGVCHIGGTVPR